MTKKRTTAKTRTVRKKRTVKKVAGKKRVRGKSSGKTAARKASKRVTGKKASGKTTPKAVAAGRRAAKKRAVRKTGVRKRPVKRTSRTKAVRRKPPVKRTVKKKPAAGRPRRLAKGMSRADILKFEKELLEEKHRILRQGDFADELMDNSSESSGNGSRGEYDAEMGSQNYRRELASRLKSLESDSLREIDAALRRINEGTYGTCERCGRPIAKARLEVVPHARICVKCLRGTRAG